LRETLMRASGWLGRRPRTVIALGILCVLLAAAIILFQISRARCFSLTGEAICRVETNEPIVALTFDDGPTPEGVAWAVSVLRPTHAHATFFLIGGEIAGREALVRQLLAEGHEVGNHSFSHARMVLHSPSFYEEEIMRTDALLRGAGVPAPDLFRPPYGKKLIGLPNALARHGYRMIMWDVEDPPGAATPQDYADAIVREARPGSIVLMHIMYSGNRIAREALPLVVRGLEGRGLRIVTVGELLRQRG
jgi:peptidoglycan/xylan/chitin deacetylase (PgdA/CDA1 family)